MAEVLIVGENTNNGRKTSRRGEKLIRSQAAEIISEGFNYKEV
ncbi:hypothetical protein [uncultured Pontibacter sp.]|nr:hypothetical protein [uncultured Pontibacter sp.]